MTHVDKVEDAHAAEAQERWGNTDAYRESARRTKAYSKADVETIKAELNAIEAAFADALASGVSPDAKGAIDLAERARQHIDRWYYPCSPAMHAQLADMYIADERFRAHYDERAAGLAEYVSSAIKANQAVRSD